MSAGIGSLVSAWFSNQGGVELILISRSGQTSRDVPHLRQARLPATVLQGNASVAHEAAAAVQCAGTRQLVAILHAGGVLQDGMLMTQSVQSLRCVWSPKLGFVESTVGCARRSTVQLVGLFSSISSFLGTVGQTNYAAANNALNYWAEVLTQNGVQGDLGGGWDSFVRLSRKGFAQEPHHVHSSNKQSPPLFVRLQAAVYFGELGQTLA